MLPGGREQEMEVSWWDYIFLDDPNIFWPPTFQLGFQTMLLSLSFSESQLKRGKGYQSSWFWPPRKGRTKWCEGAKLLTSWRPGTGWKRLRQRCAFRSLLQWLTPPAVTNVSPSSWSIHLSGLLPAGEQAFHLRAFWKVYIQTITRMYNV